MLHAIVLSLLLGVGLLKNCICFIFPLSYSRTHHKYFKSIQNAVGNNYDEDNNEEFKPLLLENPKYPSFLNRAQSFRSISEYNWCSGSQKIKLIFEGTQTVRKFHFMGDLIAFAMIDGRVSLVRMSTGEILDKYSAHKSEVTALFFNGIDLFSGGGDGILNVYNLTFSNPRKLGTCLKQYNLHNGMITGIRVLPYIKKEKESSTIISCGADRKLIGVDKNTGVVKFSTNLSSNPVCMDAINNYIALGMQDGRLIFFSSTSGKQLLQFQAHSNRVQCLHFISQDIIITGGIDGTVRRWDITGERNTKLKPTRIIDCYFRDAFTNEYIQDQTFSNENFIKDLPTGSFKIYRESDSNNSPVVSVQGDDRKIVAAYQDGSIKVWDVNTCFTWFTLQGRSNDISTVQYDATRMISDGTYSQLYLHDFSDDAEFATGNRNKPVNDQNKATSPSSTSSMTGNEDFESEGDEDGRPTTTS